MSESTSTSKTHLGLIGLGQISRHHIAGIMANPSLQLDAVYDIDPTVPTPAGVRICKNADELLEMPDITHIVICTPPASHAKYVKQVLAAGKIPLVEKPLVPAKDNLPVDKENKVYTIYHWQFAPEVLAVKKAIEDNGETIESINITIADPYLTSFGFHVEEKQLSKKDAWNDSGINALSFVACLLGDMSKADNIHLRHLRYVDGVSVNSLATMEIEGVKVTINVVWDWLTEYKKSVIRTNKQKYVVNHKKQRFLSLRSFDHFREDRHVNRLSCHYVGFYGSSEWQDKQPGNMELTRSLHAILSKQGYTVNHAFRERVFNFLRKTAKGRPERVMICLCAAVLILFMWYIYGMADIRLHNPLGLGKHNFEMMDFVINILASLVGILVSYLFYQGVQWVKRRNEDAIKVEFSDRELRQQYDSHYLQHGSINKSDFSVYYDPFFDPDKKPANIVVEDSLEKFELDNFIRFQYFSIREAHADDSFRNEPTIRLRHQELQGDTLTLYTQRANYLAHMLTNRAIDYRINGMASMRMLFEYQSTLTPLRDSKFANHIGINALILIDGGRYLLLPQRSSRATISKRMFTASVATRLKTDDYNQQLKPDVLNTLSLDVILSAMAIDKEEWEHKRKQNKDLRINQTLIGAGRDIYEGGKPTVFYLVEIPGLRLEEYMSMKYYRQTHFDEIQRIFVFDYAKLAIRNNCIRTRGEAVARIKSANWFVSFFYKGRLRGEIRPEKNLLALLWTNTERQK